MSDARTIQDLYSNVTQLISNVRDLKVKMETDELRSAGFYTGIDVGQAKQFSDRLFREDTFEKLHLADYLLRDARRDHPQFEPCAVPFGTEHDADQKIFCESGTTFGSFIGKFAERLTQRNAPSKPAAAITNNMLVLTAWVNLIRDVSVTFGSFMPRYYGFFPFSDALDAIDWDREAAMYDLIRREVSSCDRVLATCSQFSLLAGPLVGSRANALFKHAMYRDLHEKQDFMLLLAVGKIIPTAKDLTARKRFNDCYCVLDAPAQLHGKSMTMSQWHEDWLRPDGRKSVGKEFQRGLKNTKEPLPPKLMNSSKAWLEVAPMVKVIVGLADSEKDYAYVEADVKHANQALKVFKNYRIELSPKSMAVAHRVAVLQYRIH